MEIEFIDYLLKFNLPDEVFARLENAVAFCKNLLPKERIVTVFLSESFTEESGRKIESLCFFSNNFVFESKKIFEQFSVDMTYYKQRVEYWEFVRSIDDRNASLYVKLDSKMSLSMRASDDNISNLRAILENQILPNCIPIVYSDEMNSHSR